MQFLDHPILLAAVAVFSWPIYTTLARMFFGDRYEDVGETLRYLIQCDWVSLMKGRYWNDRDATFKFNAFLLLCAAWVAAVTELLCRAFY